jgi:hypothetical protein
MIDSVVKKIILFLVFISSALAASSQEQFSVSVSTSPLSSAPGWHSGAFAEWSGKWIFIGGRINGLHNFQAGQAFDVFTRNDSVYVVDPVNDQRWALALTGLQHSMYEAICSSNMEYFQDDSMLYMIGGYGRNDSVLNKITFPTLTAVNLSSLVNDVISGSAVTGDFRQVRDTILAVAGGHLEKIDSTYYLALGHRFDGQYDENAGSVFFVQHYSNQIRKFNIHDDGINLSISNYQVITDTTEFHRRDYNLVPQIFPNGEYGLTVFGGVFQKFANLPYLNPIDIYPDSASVNHSFNQNLNQYETASMPLHDSASNIMHTIFFGGMSLYTYDTTAHALVQDTLIPFVKTISKVTRDGAGNLAEYSLPVEMPALIGTNSIFIPDRNVDLNHHAIIELNSLSAETHAGWIVGGIQSDFPNIAHLDPDGMSRASSEVYDVFIHKSMAGIKDDHLIKSGINDLYVYPNPSHGIFNIEFSVSQKLKVEAVICNADGKKITTLVDGNVEPGELKFTWNSSHSKSGIYFCRIKSSGYTKSVKMIVDK